jgi:cell division septation protein DedD
LSAPSAQDEDRLVSIEASRLAHQQRREVRVEDGDARAVLLDDPVEEPVVQSMERVLKRRSSPSNGAASLLGSRTKGRPASCTIADQAELVTKSWCTSGSASRRARAMVDRRVRCPRLVR